MSQPPERPPDGEPRDRDGVPVDDAAAGHDVASDEVSAGWDRPAQNDGSGTWSDPAALDQGWSNPPQGWDRPAERAWEPATGAPGQAPGQVTGPPGGAAAPGQGWGQPQPGQGWGQPGQPPGQAAGAWAAAQGAGQVPGDPGSEAGQAWAQPGEPGKPGPEQPVPPAWGQPGQAAGPAWGQPGQVGGQAWAQPGEVAPDQATRPGPERFAQPGYDPPPGQHSGWGSPAPGWGHAPPGWAMQRPKPGIIPLRPISLGEIYDGAFQAIRTNPRTMIGIAAVVIAVTAVLTSVPQAAAFVSFGDSDLFDPERAADLTAAEVATGLSGLVTSLLLPALVQSLAITVVTGLLIIAVSNAVLGRKTAPSVLWQRTRRRVWALIGLSLLLVVASVVIAMLLVTPGVLVLALGGDAVLGVPLLLVGALLAVVVYVALFYGLWALAPAALLLEDLSVVGALRRSWRLVRRSFWRVLGIMLLTTLIVGFVSGIISVPFAILSTVVGLAQDQPYESFVLTLLQLLVSQIGSVLSGAVLYPLTAAVTALLYIDLRMRTEGLDVELMRATSDVQP